MSGAAAGPWYVRSFGARYRQLYSHRSESEAGAALDTLFPEGALAGRRVLDLACGAGRHLRVLRRRGAWAIGLDLSPALLAEARLAESGDGVLRGDMRAIPVRDRGVDLLLSMFTSFGYFDTEEEHARLALEMGRVAGEEIVLDVPEPESLRLSLVRESERRLPEATLREERWLEENPLRVCKRTRVVDMRGDERERYDERVMLFERAQLERFFADAGFALADAHGDYDGRPLEAGRSARQVLRFRRGS